MWPAADRECKEALCSVLQVTDRSMRAVAENCPELQFVGFMGCPVTSQGVIHLTAVSTPQISIPSQKMGLFSLLILKGLDENRRFVLVGKWNKGVVRVGIVGNAAGSPPGMSGNIEIT